MGYDLALTSISVAAIPVSVIAVFLAAIQFYLFDRKLKKKVKSHDENAECIK